MFAISTEGCQNFYAFFLDKRYGRETSIITRNNSAFDLPVKKNKAGECKMTSTSFVRVCMMFNFFIEEADEWRKEVWDIIRMRPDPIFSSLTIRAGRIQECLPDDWGNDWDNVQFAVSVENQKRADERLPYLLDIPSHHRWVSVKHFIRPVDLSRYLSSGKIETVLAGGENYLGLHPLQYEWIKSL